MPLEISEIEPTHLDRSASDLAVQGCWPAPFSPDLPADGEPDDERYRNDGQNDGYERASAPCRTPTYAGVVIEYRFADGNFDRLAQLRPCRERPHR
jgi:hypothetical protein